MEKRKLENEKMGNRNLKNETGNRNRETKVKTGKGKPKSKRGNWNRKRGKEAEIGNRNWKPKLETGKPGGFADWKGPEKGAEKVGNVENWGIGEQGKSCQFSNGNLKRKFKRFRTEQFLRLFLRPAKRK